MALNIGHLSVFFFFFALLVSLSLKHPHSLCRFSCFSSGRVPGFTRSTTYLLTKNGRQALENHWIFGDVAPAHLSQLANQYPELRKWREVEKGGVQEILT